MLNFLKSIRTVLDKAGQQDGKTYRLSTAVNGGVDRIQAMQLASNPNSVPDFWKQVGTICDQLNIMNYDYHGGYDAGSPAYFQANFDFINTGNNSVGKENGWSIKNSVDAYIALGVPAKKLVVGIPLYARTMQVPESTNGGLFSKVIGAGFGDYEKGILDYKCITNPVGDPATGCGSSSPVTAVQSMQFFNSNKNTEIFNLYGRDAYQVWGYSSAAASFVTFDDVWTTTQKTKYVKTRNINGVMFWEIDGDSTNADLSLIKTAKKTLNA